MEYVAMLKKMFLGASKVKIQACVCVLYWPCMFVCRCQDLRLKVVPRSHSQGEYEEALSANCSTDHW